MTRTKYPDEFKEQVVREILEKKRTITSVAASYDLVPQTVEVWVAKYKKKYAEAQDPEATVEVEPISDEATCAEIQAYVDERAAAGVVIAQTVTSITCADGVVTAIFDPGSISMDQETFDYLNAFSNLADFIGNPLAFDNDQGQRLRTRVTRVDTVMANGSSAGSMTAAEIYKNGTGKDLEPLRRAHP